MKNIFVYMKIFVYSSVSARSWFNFFWFLSSSEDLSYRVVKPFSVASDFDRKKLDAYDEDRVLGAEFLGPVGSEKRSKTEIVQFIEQ